MYDVFFFFVTRVGKIMMNGGNNCRESRESVCRQGDITAFVASHRLTVGHSLSKISRQTFLCVWHVVLVHGLRLLFFSNEKATVRLSTTQKRKDTRV